MSWGTAARVRMYVATIEGSASTRSAAGRPDREHRLDPVDALHDRGQLQADPFDDGPDQVRPGGSPVRVLHLSAR